MERPATRSAQAGAARHDFAIAHLPEAPADPAAAVQSLMSAIADQLSELAADRADVARVCLFLPGPLSFERAEPLVADALGDPPPPFELLAQPVAGGGAAALTWLVSGDGVSVDRLDATSARVAQPEAELVVVGHGPAEPPTSTAADFAVGLRRFDARLRDAGLPLGLGNAIKLWTVFPSTPELGTEQAFNEFNRGRAGVFDEVEFERDDAGPLYPASTGVGALDNTAPLSGIALARQVRTLRVENPAQVSAFRYPSERIATPALFSRAIALDLGSDVMTFVAGTGSTVGSKTAHVGDPAAQAEQVLTNIDRLITAENLAHSGAPVPPAGLAPPSPIFVYAADEPPEP